MENQDKLHQQFKEAAGKAEDKGFARMDAVWNRVEEKLDNNKQRRIAAWWKYSGIGAMFLLFTGVGFFLLNNEKSNTLITPKVTPENNVTVIDTQKVKETFDPAKTEPKVEVVANEKIQLLYKESGTTTATASATNAETIPEPEVSEDYVSKGYATATSTGDVSSYLTPNAESVKTKDTEQIAFADKEPGIDKKTKKVTGIITDSQGLPVPGVNVTIGGTNNAVQTDFDGKYLIDAKEGEKLIASYVGLQQQTVTIGKRKDQVNFQLDDAKSLENVLVEGYRTSTRSAERRAKREERKEAKKAAKENESTSFGLNTAVAALTPIPSTRNYRDADPQQSGILSPTTISSKTIEGRPNANFIQTLQGQSPGLSITTGSGQPGEDIANDYNYYKGDVYKAIYDTLSNGTILKRDLPQTIAIRCIGSINGNNEPLYVVNGTPISNEVFKKIDPKDIESINVINDAASTSLYGVRGTNGVIIIKTKKTLTKRKIKKLVKETEKEQKEHPETIHFMSVTPKPQPIEVDQEEYENFVENQFENPATTPLSTFSIDVDNASYTNIRRFLNNGETVPKDAVRVEEMINFFKYQYPQPKDDEPFSINTEYSDAPWNPQHKLLKIGLQGKVIPDDNLPASNFVFLIDVSGSMNDTNKLPLLKQSMKLLVNQMRKKDRIAIVVYAGAAGLVLPSTNGDEKEKIFAALENLSAGGSTAGGAGIELAYKTAEENFVKNGNNRVILATDGDFNVGASSNTDMQTLIEEKRKSGVFLTCLGYGMGNYKDSKLETLADKGNGNYAYIDNMQEADRYLNKEFKGSMYAIAKDVKIQIEFNPKHVQSYRLIGYENRKLRDQDFANDAIDAGELGSGHTVTALYEIIPVGTKSEYFNPVPELKYSQPIGAANQYNYELATIKFRSKKPSEDKSTEIVKVIPNSPLPLQNTSGDYKFSAAVAWFGLKLRDSKLIPNKKTDDIKALAKQGLQNDADGYRAEFVRLAEMVK